MHSYISKIELSVGYHLDSNRQMSYHTGQFYYLFYHKNSPIKIHSTNGEFYDNRGKWHTF